MKIWQSDTWGLLLRPCSKVYGAVVDSRNRQYGTGRRESIRLPVMVISVGNITVGGTGKSPLVDYLVRQMTLSDKRVGIVSRGYGRRSKGVVVVSDGNSIRVPARESGDEPMMLARRNPGVCVVVGEDRVAAGRKAVELDCDILVLDDAFQHRRMVRDLDLVVIDASNPWGNGHLIPAGSLRESLSSLSRAGGFVLTRVDECSETDTLEKEMREYTDAPVFRTQHFPTSLIELKEFKRYPISEMKSRRVAAFSAIGNPTSFRQTLEAAGLNVVEELRFRDHHWYKQKDMNRIRRKTKESDAEFIVTTEKDAVRLPDTQMSDLPIYALTIDLDFIDNIGQFDNFIEAALDTFSEEAHG